MNRTITLHENNRHRGFYRFQIEFTHLLMQYLHKQLEINKYFEFIGFITHILFLKVFDSAFNQG